MEPYKSHTTRLKKVDKFVRNFFKRLPSICVYHNFDHTLDPINGVVAVSNELALMEGVPEHDRELVVTGAYLHETGYTDSPMRIHEERGAEISMLQ